MEVRRVMTRGMNTVGNRGEGDEVEKEVGDRAALAAGVGRQQWGIRVDDAGGPRRHETPVSLWSTRSRAANPLFH